MIKPRLAAIDIKFTSPPSPSPPPKESLWEKERGAAKQRSFINQNRIFLNDKAPISGN